MLTSAPTALEIACGAGRASVWLAQNGADVSGYDISPVAIEQARALAAEAGVADRCRFAAADFDSGLPPGPAVDLVLCHLFRDAALYPAMVDRLLPGGVLAIAVLSAVGGETGPFRAEAGELKRAFCDDNGAGGRLDEIASHEGDGVAWLLARKP